MMIYQDVRRFLKRYLKTPSTSYDWSNKDNFMLLSFLQERYSDEQIENNAMEIRQAFRDFFESLGHLIVQYKHNVGILYKLVPYQVEAKDSVHLQKIIDIIQENRRAIKHPYNAREDQIALLGKIRRKINAQLVETKEKVNKKELIRYAIKRALGLSEKDMVLTQKKKFVIKLFGKNNFISKKQEEIKDAYSEKDIEAYYKELFEDMSIENFLDEVMTSLFVDELDFKKINNSYYEKNVLILVKQKIIEELKEHVSDNDEYIEYVANYIMKKNIINIHQKIAIEIFELIAEKDKNAQEFLNYYTGQVYVENGTKYVIPEISTEDGKRWNINSLNSIASVWLRSRTTLKKLQIRKENLRKNNDNVEPLYNETKKQFEDNLSKYEDIKRKYFALEREIQKIELTLNNEFKGDMDTKKEAQLSSKARNNNRTLKDHRYQLGKLKEIVAKSEISFKANEVKFFEFRNECKKLQQQIEKLKNDLTINSDSFHSILSSVVKALMKRKKKIE